MRKINFLLSFVIISNDNKIKNTANITPFIKNCTIATSDMHNILIIQYKALPITTYGIKHPRKTFEELIFIFTGQ